MLFQTHIIISFFLGDTNKKTPLQRETQHRKATLTPNRSTEDSTPYHKKFLHNLTFLSSLAQMPWSGLHNLSKAANKLFPLLVSS
jgi:hypothetical protein